MWEPPLKDHQTRESRHSPVRSRGAQARDTGGGISHGWLIVLLLLAGCGGASVSVPPMLPVPVVERIPLAIGVQLSDPLISYVHEEKLEGGGEWKIDLGSAQTIMFQNLLSGMFDTARVVAGPGGTGDDVDGVLVPTIEEVQFSTPEQTRSDYFEVWVKYKFELYGADGTLAGEWPLTAYGKANAGNYGMNSREPALQAAAVAALRDAMAFFTVQFQTVPVVRSWLASQLGGRS